MSNGYIEKKLNVSYLLMHQASRVSNKNRPNESKKRFYFGTQPEGLFEIKNIIDKKVEPAFHKWNSTPYSIATFHSALEKYGARKWFM